jgi:glycosyltransferase involved in cell wall biosynthesis
MAHGLPAIVADVAENVEAVGDSGVAVPYGDEAAIAAALRRLVADGDERVARGERARRRVTDLFGVDDMITLTRAVYDGVLASE